METIALLLLWLVIRIVVNQNAVQVFFSILVLSVELSIQRLDILYP